MNEGYNNRSMDITLTNLWIIDELSIDTKRKEQPGAQSISLSRVWGIKGQPLGMWCRLSTASITSVARFPDL